MSKVFIGEFIKLWGTKILWLIGIGSLFPLMINSAGASTQKFSWDSFYFFNWNITHFLLGPIIFSIFIGYVFGREYYEKTINSVFTYPYNRTYFLLSKYLLTLIIIFIISLLSLVGTIFVGWFVIDEPLTKGLILEMLKGNLVTIILQWLLITPAMFLTILSRSYFPAVIFGVVVVISSLMIMGTDYNIYFPFTAVALIQQKITTDFILTSKFITFSSILITSILFFVLSLIYFSKKDVHSG